MIIPMKQSNEDLIIQAKSGNKEALNKLFKQNIPLTYFIANRYISSGIEYEELLSLCNLGMMKAYVKFNQNKHLKFSTYAIKCMTNQILQSIRNLNASDDAPQNIFNN